MVIPVSDTAISSIHEATPGGFRFRPGMKPPELFDESLAKSFGEKKRPEVVCRWKPYW